AAALLLRGTGEALGWWRAWLRHDTPLRAALTLATAAAALFLLTWKRLVDSLLLGLTGREWLIKGCQYALMAVFLAACLFGAWLAHSPGWWSFFADLLPWLLGAAVVLKLALGGWALWGLGRRGLLPRRLLARLAARWPAGAPAP